MEKWDGGWSSQNRSICIQNRFFSNIDILQKYLHPCPAKYPCKNAFHNKSLFAQMVSSLLQISNKWHYLDLIFKIWLLVIVRYCGNCFSFQLKQILTLTVRHFSYPPSHIYCLFFLLYSVLYVFIYSAILATVLFMIVGVMGCMVVGGNYYACKFFS